MPNYKGFAEQNFKYKIRIEQASKIVFFIFLALVVDQL
jgi:hypothetical protein